MEGTELITQNKRPKAPSGLHRRLNASPRYSAIDPGFKPPQQPPPSTHATVTLSLARRQSFQHRQSLDLSIANLPISVDDDESFSPGNECIPITPTESVLETLKKIPGMMIGLTLNLMLCVPFGLAFFPSEWEPFPVPRAVGIQMFLFSTLICQLVMSMQSKFPCAMGMQMVENVPFMHSLAGIVMRGQGLNEDALSTLMVMFAVSSVVVGAFFFMLGYFKLGNAVHFFPRHVIIGCIGGIGVFVAKTGFEVSTNIPIQWTISDITSYLDAQILPLWVSSVGLVILLHIVVVIFHYVVAKSHQQGTLSSLIPPIFFVSIAPLFYVVIFLLDEGGEGGVSPVETARASGWFFERAPTVPWWLMWQLFDLSVVRWDLVIEGIPTMIALTLFSLMHVPINIPSLAASTGDGQSDMNHELIVHGWSNLLSGVFGGLQNYLCYSNSVLYYKCNGGGKVCGFFLTCATTLFFVIGPSAVQYIPRCMAGCLLIYLGIDLMKEALLDSYSLFDQIEYCSVLIITVVMTSAGMTAGLGMGVILSAVAFTLQMFKHSEPIRGAMPASTLKSSRLRSPREQKHLEANLDRVTVVQVQGTLFFGNATVLSLQVDELLQGMHQGMRQGGCALYHQGDLGDEELGGSGGKRVSGMMIQRRPMRRVTIVLDFTLVRSIDSSASDTVAKIAFVAQKHRASIVFVRGSSDGFPCQAPLSDQLTQASERKQTTNTHDDEGTFKVLHVVNSLDEALEWCEDCLLADAGLDVGTRSRNTSACSRLPCDPAQEFNTVAKLIHQLCPEIDVGTEKGQEPSLTLDVAKELLKFFKRREMKAGEVLWHQSESSTFMVLVFRGKLLSVLEHEAGTSELVHPGSLIGDFGLLNRVSRTSTVTCSEDRTVVYVLNLHEWELILEQHCNLAYMLFQICIRYLGRRCNHVSNRVWESHCLPI